MDVANFLSLNGCCTGLHSFQECEPVTSTVSIQPSNFWSSTENNSNNAWNVNFSNGNVNNNNKYNTNVVRAVAALDEETKIGWIQAFDDCCSKKKLSTQCNDYRVDYELDLWHLVGEIYLRQYVPARSTCFMVTRPRLREIFAAHFRDRIVQHWIIIRLEPLFERRFTEHGNVSFNCRKKFGTMKAVAALEADILTVSENYTKEAHVARFDMRSFFMSIDLEILWMKLETFIVSEYKGDDIDTLLYLTKIVVFHRPQNNCYVKGNPDLWNQLAPHKSLRKIFKMIGMAIGNHTSQQFANFYLSFFDEFMIWLCARYGCRYERFVDDFTVVGDKWIILNIIRPLAEKYLQRRLGITLHRDKFYIQPVVHGVGFVGTVLKPGRRYISNRTVGGFIDKIYVTERICQAIINGKRNCRNLALLKHCVSALNSYLGFVIHTCGHNVRQRIFAHASNGFWGCCYVLGDYRVVKIKKHYQLALYLQELEHAEHNIDIRRGETASGDSREKTRTKKVHRKLRH